MLALIFWVVKKNPAYAIAATKGFFLHPCALCRRRQRGFLTNKTKTLPPFWGGGTKWWSYLVEGLLSMGPNPSS